MENIGLMRYKSVVFLLLPGFAISSVSNGPYVGIEIGAANQIVNFTPSTFGLNTNGSSLYNSSVGFLTRLNIGYNLDRYNGFELGTTYNFETNHNLPNGDGSLNTTATTLDLSYLLYLPTFVSKWSIFGRFGVAYDWINTSATCCDLGNGNPSGSSFADVLGAGLMHRITPNTSFRLEWIANGLIYPPGINNGAVSVGNWTNQTFQLGMNYHF